MVSPFGLGLETPYPLTLPSLRLGPLPLPWEREVTLPPYMVPAAALGSRPVPERRMKLEYHPSIIPLTLLVLVLGGLVFLFFRYGTVDRCDMMRQEVRQRFPTGEVPADIRDAPGGRIVVGLVEGGSAKLLTWDMSPNDCALKLVKLWGASDTEIGAVLLEE